MRFSTITPTTTYKYSDPSLVYIYNLNACIMITEMASNSLFFWTINRTPAKIVFIKWPTPEDESDDEERETESEGEEQVIPGLLKGVLDDIANERAKAVHIALNPPDKVGPGILEVSEAKHRTAEASTPFTPKNG
ncbi:hypothetical protein ACMFMG_011791 [Clarireedia jacksonii]